MRVYSGLALLVFLFASASLYTGCGDNPSPKEVAGTYVIRYDYATELLRLDSSGQYLQVVIINGDTATTCNVGIWDIGAIDNPVCLHGGLRVDDGFGRLHPDYTSPVDGYVAAGYWREWFGNVTLMKNEDVGLEYVKIE